MSTDFDIDCDCESAAENAATAEESEHSDDAKDAAAAAVAEMNFDEEDDRDVVDVIANMNASGRPPPSPSDEWHTITAGSGLYYKFYAQSDGYLRLDRPGDAQIYKIRGGRYVPCERPGK